jgi:hypothetical protein
MEFVFASHSFDVWESWMLEGPLDECRLVNCRNPSVSSFVASYGCICYELVVLIFIDTFKIRSIMAIGDLDFLFFF